MINVPKESWNNMEELLLEELEVFKVRKLLYICPLSYFQFDFKLMNLIHLELF